MEPGIPV